MATQEVVTWECDWCPKPTPASDFEFYGPDGIRYEIDLCEKHGARLTSLLEHQRKALEPFVRLARERRPLNLGPRRRRRSESERKRRAAIRAQAIKDGHKLEPRGRLPVSIVRKYEGKLS